MDTRERIIRTALSLFLQRGYDRVSINQIARASGVTKGGIYHYFESKESLFREALGFITAEMGKWSAARFREVRTAEDLLQALFGSIGHMKDAFSGIVGETAQGQPYTFLEVLLNAARRDEGVRREMGKIYSQTRASITEVLTEAREAGEIRSDIDCAALALEITALIEGIMLFCAIDETVDPDTVGGRISRNIWKGIAK
jgi:AcrR family transcriptional regulator